MGFSYWISHKKAPPDRAIALIFFLLVFISGCVLSLQIGPAWDEPDNIVAGGVYANYFQHGFDDSLLVHANRDTSIFINRVFTQEPSIARYPPIPNYIGTAVTMLGERLFGRQFVGKDIIIIFHWVTAAFFALLVASIFMFARLLGMSVPVSIVTACLAWFSPTLFGHGLSNLKDTAQVCLFTISLYLFVKGFVIAKKSHDIFFGAIIWGLALATKMNAVYVPIVWAVSMGFFAFISPVSSSRKKSFFTLIGQGIIILPIGILIAIAVWPYLWHDPLTRVVNVFQYFSTVGRGYRVWWDGAYYVVGAGKALWWYPWANLLFSTPIPVLILSGIGMLSSIRSKPRYRIVLLFWLCIPILRSFMPTAAFYDGIRHFLEVMPAWILLSGLGLDFFYRWLLERHQAISKTTFYIGSIVLCLYTCMISLFYFPYGTGYFNFFAHDANSKFDRDIEGLALKEGMDYLNKKYPTSNIWAPVAGHLSWYYVKGGSQYVYNQYEADSIILINKASHLQLESFTPLVQDMYRLDHTIHRGEAIFGWVFRKKISP